MFFSFDNIQTNEKIIKHVTFIGSNDAEISFSRGEKLTVKRFSKKVFLII